MKFCDYWMNEDPFSVDMKDVKTHWHECPFTFPTRKNTILWVMDDWRTMSHILRSNIASFKQSQKHVDISLI